MSSEGQRAKDLIDELTQIEFATASDIFEYCQKVRDLQKALATEVIYAAEELQARLREVPAPKGESRRAVRARARAVSRHLRRSGEASTKAGLEAVRTWASLLRHFEYALGRRKTTSKTVDLER